MIRATSAAAPATASKTSCTTPTLSCAETAFEARLPRNSGSPGPAGPARAEHCIHWTWCRSAINQELRAAARSVVLGTRHARLEDAWWYATWLGKVPVACWLGPTARL